MSRDQRNLLVEFGDLPLDRRQLFSMLDLEVPQIFAQLVVFDEQNKREQGTADQDDEEDDDQLDHGLRASLGGAAVSLSQC